MKDKWVKTDSLSLRGATGVMQIKRAEEGGKGSIFFHFMEGVEGVRMYSCDVDPGGAALQLSCFKHTQTHTHIHAHT